MKRDRKTGTPDFYAFARDYLHTYLPTVARRSPKTIEAYRISLECFLDYLRDQHNIERANVSFDHFDRHHLQGWLAWMIDQRHYAARTVALRLSTVKAFLTYCSGEDLTLVALSQAAKALRSPAIARKPIEYLTEPQTRAVLAAFTNGGPWRGLDDLEIATCGWVSWLNDERIHGELDDCTPAEIEAAYHHDHPTEPGKENAA